MESGLGTLATTAHIETFSITMPRECDLLLFLACHVSLSVSREPGFVNQALPLSVPLPASEQP